MIYNVTLCRQLIFEDAIEAESEEEAVEIAMERNGYDELNWHRNGPTQVICVEPTYDGSDPYRMHIVGMRNLMIRWSGKMMRKAWYGIWINHHFYLTTMIFAENESSLTPKQPHQTAHLSKKLCRRTTLAREAHPQTVQILIHINSIKCRNRMSINIINRKCSSGVQFRLAVALW